MKLQAHTTELKGTSYEIGRQLGQTIRSIPSLEEHLTCGMPGFGETEAQEAVQMFNAWCPGLSEELQGFADVLEVPLHRVVYYSMTYLLPRCSHIALSPATTKEGRPLVARNYEFCHRMEDFCLVKTAVEGRYTHMGTRVLLFGREDGFNEHGLSVTMSSCGFPVGAMPNMRSPKLVGLQYWAVLRALLENCKTVEEAIAYMEGMPIAYNLNMMLVDKQGRVALAETLDGSMDVQRLVAGEKPGYLHATNHAVLPELAAKEPQAMRHSLLRYNWVKEKLDGAGGLTAEDLKGMLLSPFPQGLACHYYEDFFGTTKSMVIDPACGIIELCWGGELANGWKRYSINEPLVTTTTEIEIHNEPFDPAMGAFLPL